MENLQITTIREQLKQQVSEGDLLKAIEIAKSQLPEQSDKRNIFIQFEREFKDLKLAQIKNIVSFEQAQLQTSRLTSNLLSLIDILDESDLAIPNAGGTAGKKTKAGSVLYSIPSVMTIQQEKQCVVRLSFDETFLFDNFLIGSDAHIRDLRKIDSNMEVELVDPGEEKSFAIRTISSVMQKVERDDYTEWLFFVKPLSQGKFPLYLKVSIITKEDGEKFRKELVLQEFIEVVARDVEDEPLGVQMRHSGYVFFLGMPAAGVGNDNPSDQPPPAAGGKVASSLFKNIAARLTQIVGGLAMVAGGWWITQSYLQDKKPLPTVLAAVEQDTTYSPADKLVVDPPFEGLDVPPAIQFARTDRDTILHFPTGATAEIPAHTFIDENGKPVVALVEIRLTEFRKPHEIIASGIPMKVRGRQGRDEWMQTAGMFDIAGFSEGKPVFIAEGKSVSVKIPSPVNGVYPFWEFKPEIGNWKNIGESNAVPIDPEKITATKAEIRRLENVTARAPQKPLQNDGTFITIGNEVERNILAKFPELSSQRNIIWLYIGKKEDLPEGFSERNNWHPPTLKAGPKSGQYYMTYETNTEQHVLLVARALSGAELASETAIYEKLQQEYLENVAFLQQKKALLEEQSAFYRTMAVQRFGIYNYDYLWKQPEAIAFTADFDFGDIPEQMKQLINVYLVTGDDRVVVSLPASDWRQFRISLDQKNRLLAVLPGNKMAVFTEEDFKAAASAMRKAENGTYVFKMKIQPRAVQSLPEVHKTLVSI